MKNAAAKVLRTAVYIGMLSAISGTAGAQAQSDNPDLLRAYAAGFKAQTLCSGIFNGGKTQKQVEQYDMTAAYSRIANIIPELRAKVNEAEHTVSVSFNNELPPRLASHNPMTGCTALPIGAVVERPSNIRDTRLSPGALDNRPWPIGDKDAVAKRTRGTKMLHSLVENAVKSNRFGGTSSAMLVLKDGKIAAESYLEGHNKHSGGRIWSIAKSVTSSYIGFISHQQKSDFGENPNSSKSADPRRDIGIDNLLRMASGLHSDTSGSRTDHVDMGGGYVREWATPFPQLRPQGTHFRYANNDTMIAMLKARAEAPRLHPHNMFDRLGMTRSFAETDSLGDYLAASHMWSTPRDLARLGQLYLNNGLWPNTGPAAERILPEGWRDYVTKPSGPQRAKGGFSYGASFWLMHAEKDIPPDSFLAMGYRGQYLVIIPSEQMVIIRTGYDTQRGAFDLNAAIKAILDIKF